MKKRIRHTPEQIVSKLRRAEALRAEGKTVPEICQALGVAEQTFYRWRNQYGQMEQSEVKRLKELETENARLKKLVADLSLDKAILKEVLEGKY